jgi:LytR cell envelope-related transcriptional attenuator
VGQHSSGSSGPFVRSVLGWALPWILIAAVVIVAVWFAVTAVGGRDLAVDGRPSRNASSPRESPSPGADSTPTPTPTPTRSDPSPSPSRPRGSEGGELITEGVTVQVVNATGGIAGAAADMANQLASLGYSVEAIVTGLTTDQTTVYWSSDTSRRAATALANHFGWPSAPAPASLSPEVDVHVIVAPDVAGA